MDPATATKADGSAKFRLVETVFGPMWALAPRPMTDEQRSALAALRDRQRG